jgi:Tfp pilus assembly protein PilO
MSAQDNQRQQPEEQPQALARRQQIRVRVEKLKQSRRRSLLGLPEIIGLSISGLLLLLVLATYFFSLAPARARLEALNKERDGLQRRLREAQAGINSNADTQATVTKINESLQRFENERLAGRSEGRMALYTQLNELIRRNSLRNTAGPNYVALDPLGSDQQQGANGAPARQKSGNARWQTIYPGIGVNLTVEGAYQNLRRFVRDIELSRQFIVINAVELESIKDTEAPPPIVTSTRGPDGAAAPVAGQPRRAMLVSLRLDMAVYFKRGNEPEALPAAATETH